ncbi:MAG: TraR/DksA family transcriptional regulator [Gammaproteobacteria bacterium]
MDMAYYKQKLLNLQAELQLADESSKEAASTVALDQTRVGRLSRMDALQGQAMSKATRQRRELELQRIAVALKHIESGDYGYCMECGEEIAPARLDIDPATPLCINCASKRDI